jgi:hypothetical protein
MLKHYSAYLLTTSEQDIETRFGKNATYRTIVEIYLKAYERLMKELPGDTKLKEEYQTKKPIYEAMVKSDNYPDDFLTKMKTRFDGLEQTRSSSIQYTLPVPGTGKQDHDAAVAALKAQGFEFKPQAACGYKRYVLEIPVGKFFDSPGGAVSSSGSVILGRLAKIFEAHSGVKIRIIAEADIPGGTRDIKQNAAAKAAMEAIKEKGLSIWRWFGQKISSTTYKGMEVITNAFEDKTAGDQSRIVFVLQFSNYTPALFCDGLRVHSTPGAGQ